MTIIIRQGYACRRWSAGLPRRHRLSPRGLSSAGAPSARAPAGPSRAQTAAAPRGSSSAAGRRVLRSSRRDGTSRRGRRPPGDSSVCRPPRRPPRSQGCSARDDRPSTVLSRTQSAATQPNHSTRWTSSDSTRTQARPGQKTGLSRALTTFGDIFSAPTHSSG